MSTKIILKTAEEIKRLQHAGNILAEVLQTAAAALKPGMRPTEISALVGREIERRGAEAPFLGHQGFPAPICISVNDEVVHGIPGANPFADGDLVGLDLGVRYQGMIADGAITVPVGKVDTDARRLLDGTAAALKAGVAAARAGNRVGDISAAVERVLRANRLAVITDLVGHGVGHELWEEPQIPNYGKAGAGPRLVAGMTIAIEPMATLGTHEVVIDASDGWTVRTADGSLSAQFEHTVIITADGPPVIATSSQLANG